MTTTSRRLLMVILAATAVLAGVAVLAQGFPQADSATVLRRADGSVHDQSEADADPHWVFNGSFVLQCRGGACADVPLGSVSFDLAVNMVRPDGASSHTHQFSDFVATAVTVDGLTDTLVVEGTIVGTGAFGGISDVVITLGDVATGGFFLIEFPGNGHILGPLGGVIVRSS